jgi:hypothetical protein
MYYVCKENNQLTAVLNYRPNVSAQVTVIEISDADHDLLLGGNHYFNTDTNSIQSKSTDVLAQQATQEANVTHQEFLNSTDWKVLRHIRQKALGVPTSLTEEDYLDLERQRQSAAEAIR